jgi:hypothetical protein
MKPDPVVAGRPLPHERVYVRLAPSPLQGIGVFAIRAIAKGTNIFANDRTPIDWVDAAEVEARELSEEEKKLYDDFAIARDGKLGVPRNFNLLTTGWYLNEPAEGEEPNVAMNADDDFIALRDIVAGEELTTRYSDFSATQEKRPAP